MTPSTPASFPRAVPALARDALSACRQHARACLHFPSRPLATLAETPASSSASTSTPQPAPADPHLPKPIINAAVILNRAPLLTRTPTMFERAYYAYHARIQRALFNPFPSDFYFKQGSLLEAKFVKEEKEREREAFGGPWVLKRKQKPESSSRADGDEEPMPRITEADRTGDVKSLDRMGERNLYLLLLGKDHTGKQTWRFPYGDLKEHELLHEAAERDLEAECGTMMDTWIVSRNPIGVYQPPLPADAAKKSLAQTHLFFYKAHILAGQVRPDGKNITDFAWLTKQEIQPRVDQNYWASIKDILSDF
ncbi:54S ribosomal protein L17, mitochondrial [Grifola frondosa]|uniref:Large ribosomal subunit protein mL46 n=1 Tax=Grifola frondosa TaxID=5627 RepID=A0A1C7MF03_GRIFR|nr:54S ribosomal protein L17, mitochondrial [Grifola frondosa]